MTLKHIRNASRLFRLSKNIVNTVGWNVFVETANVEEPEVSTYNDSKYLVWSSKCKIPNVEPFTPEVKFVYSPKKYVSCSSKRLLTYILKQSNVATLYVNKTVTEKYTKNGISCCYINVTRGTDKKQPDLSIKYSACQEFNTNVTLHEDIVFVKCQDSLTKKDIYKNVHAAITINNVVKKKIDILNKTVERKLSVLFVGIDSISRINLIREMPKTHSFLHKNDWIEMRGYNKVADNTFPNLMAILTGMNSSRAYSVCQPTKVGKLDSCKFLWYDFRKLGYITAYAEDETSINTFNFNKKGFKQQPADYYFRPYLLAAERKLKTKKVDDMTYCLGPETSGERILNVADEFSSTFKDVPNFGFFWMNTFSHNKFNSASRMDEKVLHFLESILSKGILENSAIIFISDHGLRFGEIRYTRTGWLEERLPFFYIWLPKWFKEKYPHKYKNLKANQNRLTNPYDLHMMLQEILALSSKNYTIKPSDACPKCKSLFQEIETVRSCEDAAIQQHWCTCTGYASIETKNSTVKELAKYILEEISRTAHSIGKESSRCAKFKLRKIKSSFISKDSFHTNETYLLIIIETVPEAVFEATVRLETNFTTPSFKMEGSISRLDSYSRHSKCVHDSNLKKYCYCHR